MNDPRDPLEDPLEAELESLWPHSVSPSLRQGVAERLASQFPGIKSVSFMAEPLEDSSST